MSEIPAEHRARGPRRVRCAVVTVSDTRTQETDRGGPLVAELLSAAGHEVADRAIVPDEPAMLRSAIESLVARDDVDVILLTGGTGISTRDQTFETLNEIFTKSLSERPHPGPLPEGEGGSKLLPGYGELFRLLSFQEIGPAAMLSRATGGVLRGKVVLSMPGSPAAVRLAMEKLILPELAHLVDQARR